ncbi:FtsX-like permease family protein, partial [Streptomyces albus]|uniref:FtsX-like permease family protein n=3 Tax=Streptomyces TaxID=1883 RepID=UPI000ACDFEE9
FAVAAAGAARERAGDLAVLRALGAPRRRLARAVAAEQGLVVALSAALGLALGTVLTRLFVPLLVVTGEGRAPVPDLLVRLPPGPLAWLVAAALAVPLLVVAGTALRRPAPAPALRAEREG